VTLAVPNRLRASRTKCASRGEVAFGGCLLVPATNLPRSRPFDKLRMTEGRRRAAICFSGLLEIVVHHVEAAAVVAVHGGVDVAGYSA